jgi:drug/metabolite transporter (DMT)-like permease
VPVKRRSGRSVKTSISILVMVFLGPVGQALLRKAMRDIPAPAGWNTSVLATWATQVLSSLTIWVGVACLMAYLLAEMLVLSWADYTYVQPVAASGYGVVAVLGYAVLGEKVSGLRWLGVAVICLGVLVVGRTPARTTGESRL